MKLSVERNRDLTESTPHLERHRISQAATVFMRRTDILLLRSIIMHRHSCTTVTAMVVFYYYFILELKQSVINTSITL